MIQVPKILAPQSWIHLDLENLDQSMISQPVEVHQDHSGLRINLQRSKEDDAGAGLYDKTDEAGPLEKQSVQQKGRITDHPVPQKPNQ